MSTGLGVGDVAREIVRLPARALVLVLRAYRLLVSPLYGDTCRFYPSCSAYALEAVETHGAARGGLLAARRLLRCHPWNPGGVDPVPPSARAARPAPVPTDPEAPAPRRRTA